jgi:hypothetical protein
MLMQQLCCRLESSWTEAAASRTYRVSLACANAQVGVGRDLALELLLWVDEYIVDEYSDGQRSDSVEA